MNQHSNTPFGHPKAGTATAAAPRNNEKQQRTATEGLDSQERGETIMSDVYQPDLCVCTSVCLFVNSSWRAVTPPQII